MLSFLNREISSNRELRNTTLEILGLSGGSNGLMRLIMKPTDIKFMDFMAAEKASLLQEAEDREKAEHERNAKQEQLKKDQQDAQLRAAESQARFKAAEEEEEKKREHMRKLMIEEAVRIERERQLKEQAEQLRLQQKQQKEEQERMWRQQKMLEEQERSRQESLRLAEEIATGKASQPKNTVDKDAMDVAPVSSEPSTTTSGATNEEDKMDVDTPAVVPAWDRIPAEPLDRNPTAFAPSNAPFDGSQIELPEDFFEMDAADFAREAQIQADKKRRQENEKSFLRTKAVRDRERIQKYSKFKKCFIRVRFPDRLELQGTFYPQEKTSHILQFVRDCLVQPDMPFYLYTTPPITRLSDTDNIRDQGLLPASLVHFGLPQGVTAQSPLVKPELLQDIKEKLPPSMTISSTASLNFSLPQTHTQPTTDSDGPGAGAPSSSSSSSESKGKSDGNKVPKWFAAGLKKK
eukprot:TRINITY_DN2084_c0_g2_i3.p2 TRINITY_DN2084_c0_g2~~TRINITY_DN2084_c0_g2_i3.p2  ORF type:complete len:463 (-),score=138.86 TRINITY_DN2084_c0_g2_i3:2739-4127(-)